MIQIEYFPGWSTFQPFAMAMGKALRVSQKLQDPSSPGARYSILLEQRNREDSLLFESGVIAALSAAETKEVNKQYTRLTDAYGCLGVLQLNGADSTQIPFLVLVSSCSSVGKIKDNEIFRVTAAQLISLRGMTGDEERVAEVRRILSSGTFYFSWTSGADKKLMDLTLCEQRRHKTDKTDNRFFWNRVLHLPFRRFGVDVESWLLMVICGGVEMRTVYVGHRQAKACVIARLSCERAGTRFQTRGTNDSGMVANFVETEQVIYLDEKVASHIQTRGSVPLFWEQPGVQVGSHKVRLSRGTEASAPAFALHLARSKERYGKQVIVNLLSSSLIGNRADEAKLSQLFQSHHRACPQHADVTHVLFDYHAKVKAANPKQLEELRRKIIKTLEAHMFFFADEGSVHKQQSGTHRTNCLDCLDRTNCVQTYFGLIVLAWQLDVLGLNDKASIVSRFEECYRSMWVNIGNEISKIYAGTGALQGGSKLMDGARSVTRTIQNNLLDMSKQEAINLILLGNALNNELADQARLFLPPQVLHASPDFLREMCRRLYDFSQPLSLVVAVGTFNVNGGKHFRSIVYKDRSLADWLLDAQKLSSETALIGTTDGEEERPPDIFAIGFEEIVDLNAQNIMNVSTENAKAWEQELSKTINRDTEYILLTSVQLVGVCLFVFMRPNLAPFVRDVGTDSVKTGLGGATGNKGAVGIRFSVHHSSMAFVCGHYAAGQSQVSERNGDYQEISHKLCFPMGRTLLSHDYIFWCGDFNYRIDLSKDEAKEAVERQDWETLLEKDQLKQQQREGLIFNGFSEGPLNFAPTYKYDLFSDDYDTSEKNRIPAWTDRVLWRRRKSPWQSAYPEYWSPGHCLFYGRAELKQSDHRPVIAILEVQVNRVDPEQRQKALEDVMAHQGPPDGTVLISNATSPGEEFSDEFITAFLQRIEKEAIGDVVLVRFTERGEMVVVFAEGKEALEAVSVLNNLSIDGVTVRASLKTEAWHQSLTIELTCSTVESTVVPLQEVENSQNLLEQNVEVLGDAPPKMPSLKEMHADYYTSVDEAAFDEEVVSFEDEKEINAVPPPPPVRPAPPSRPLPPRPIPPPAKVEVETPSPPVETTSWPTWDDEPVVEAQQAKVEQSVPPPIQPRTEQTSWPTWDDEPVVEPQQAKTEQSVPPPIQPRPVANNLPPVPPRRNAPPAVPQRSAPPPPIPARK